MASIIQLRGGTAAEATAANPILREREFGIETDTGQYKIGNGVDPWNTLPYGGTTGPSGGPVPTGGSAGQIIVKLDATDYNVGWQDINSLDIDADTFGGEASTWYRPKFSKIVNTNNGMYYSINFLTEDKRIFAQQGNSATTNRSTGLVPYTSKQNLTEVFFAEVDPSATLQDAWSTGGTTYYLFDNNELWGVGDNDAGQLGTGTTTDQDIPVLVSSDVSRVWVAQNVGYAHNFTHIFFEKTDGNIWGLGRSANNDLGMGVVATNSTPVAITYFSANSVEEMYAFGGYDGISFATTTDGNIHACGANHNGALGANTTTTNLSWTDVTANWGGATTGAAGAIEVLNGHVIDNNGSASYSKNFVVMLREGGNVYTCGNNDFGQIGDNSTTDISVPKLVTGLPNNISQLISFGGGYWTSVYVLMDDGDLWRWGYNGNGQLGLGSTTATLVPTHLGDATDTNVARILTSNLNNVNTDSYCINSYIKYTDGSFASAGDGANYKGLRQASLSDSNVYASSNLPIGTIEVLTGGSSDGASWCVALTEDGKVYAWGSQGNYTVHPESSRGGDFGNPILCPMS